VKVGFGGEHSRGERIRGGRRNEGWIGLKLIKRG
jgi:hypothetical protein